MMNSFASGYAMTQNNSTCYNSNIGGTEMNSFNFRMPAIIAETKEDFLNHYTNLPKNYWENNKGFPEALIQRYILEDMRRQVVDLETKLKDPRIPANDYHKFSIELGSLKLDIDDAKTELASLISDVCEVSLDVAYKIIRRMYLPTKEEFEMLFKKEYSTREEVTDSEPMVKGVFTSVSPEDLPRFRFSMSRWDDYHNDIIKTSRESYQDALDRDSAEIAARELQIEEKSKALFELKNGKDEVSSITIVELEDEILELTEALDQFIIESRERAQTIEKAIQDMVDSETRKSTVSFAKQINAEWASMTPEQQRAWAE